MLTLNGTKLSAVRICFCNVYDVLDGSVLRCTGCGIASVSLFVSNMLSLDGSKMFPACICLFLISRGGWIFVALLRQWHCICADDCQQRVDIG